MLSFHDWICPRFGRPVEGAQIPRLWRKAFTPHSIPGLSRYSVILVLSSRPVHSPQAHL